MFFDNLKKSFMEALLDRKKGNSRKIRKSDKRLTKSRKASSLNCHKLCTVYNSNM